MCPVACTATEEKATAKRGQAHAEEGAADQVQRRVGERQPVGNERDEDQHVEEKEGLLHDGASSQPDSQIVR